MKKYLVIILLLISFCKTAVANDILKDSVTESRMGFYATVEYAFEHNNDILAMKKNLSSTERDIGIARSALLPKVRFLEDFMATNNPTIALTLKLNQSRATADDFAINTINRPPSVTNFLTAGIVEQTIYNRKSMIMVKMAKKEYSANGYIYLRKQEELLNKVAQNYLAVSTNQEIMKITEEMVRDSKYNLNAAKEKYEKKLSPYSDVLRIKTALEENERKLIAAQKNLNISKRNLGLSLGTEAPIDVTDSIPDIKLKDANYYRESSITRNDLTATKIRVENAKNNIKAAQADWFPIVNATGSYNFYNSTYPFGGQYSSYIAGAYAKWDLFDGNLRKYEILKAKDKEAEAKQYLESLKKAISYKIYEVYANIEELQKDYELAMQAKQNAEEDKKLVLNKWKNSSGSIVDLIDAQRSLNDAKIEVVKNKNNLKSAIINLTYESGIITKELGLE